METVANFKKFVKKYFTNGHPLTKICRGHDMNSSYSKVKSKGMIIRNAFLLCVGILLLNQIALAGQITASVFDESYNNDQRAVVSVHYENEPLSQVLQELARKVDVGISYKTVILPSKLVTYQAENKSVFKILDTILEGTGLYATVSENRKVILIKEKQVLPVVQQETITGTVTDGQSGVTLVGVNILVKGTLTGASTDGNGEYELTVENLQDTLVVSYIGYQSQEVPINGRSTVDIAMQTQTITGAELVVTALGGQRQERSLGYSAQNISSEDIDRAPNISEGLQGQVAGLEVTSASGTVGSSSRVVLRGASSLSGDNQPLYIVDGVYIDNSNFNPPDGSEDVSDFGNAAMDIDPSDIESMNVLKGPNAAALYGSRAANGAIVITTKDGSQREGLQISINSGIKFSRPWILPDMQNQYGQGFGGQFEYVDGRGGGINDANDSSWGPPLDGRLKVQWWSNGEAVPWEPHPDNVRNFFETGNTVTNSIAVAGNNDNVNYRLSVGNNQQKGIYPNVSSDKNDFKINVGADITDDFRLEARANYVQYIARNMPDVGYSYPGNPLMGLVTWGARQVDMQKVKEAYFNNSNPYEAPGYWNRLFFDNIYWEMYENTKRQERNRLIGGVNFNYDITDWVTMNGRIGVDWYLEQRNNREAYGSITDSDGAYEESDRYIFDDSYSLDFSLDRTLNQNFDIAARIGGEIVSNQYELNQVSTAALEVPGIYSLNNSAIRPEVEDFSSKKKVYSLFGVTTLSYKEYLYLDLTGRNDWSSTLPENNLSFFYPSASLSFIFTDAYDLGLDWLDYGKLRGSWTQVGSGTDPYRLETTFLSAEPILGEYPNYTISPIIFNRDLKPELTESWEIGTELRLIESRVRFDLTYYSSVTRDQILPTPVSAGTGYETKIINAGSIENSGIEITVGGTPIRTNNLNWDIDINFAKNNRGL
jgi:TonB-linked SusC/RagA family outer membrane protein